MKNIIVTTPKSEIETASKEAKKCINDGSGYYFRTFKRKPKGIESGSKIYYVEDGYIRGYGVIAGLADGQKKCDVTGRVFGEDNNQNICHAIIPACTWKWIKPIPMKGFQGFRYFYDSGVEIAGGWLDPKPLINS